MIKTLVTVGPNSDSFDDLKKFSRHTNLFRLNGSHNTLAWHENTINTIRRACPSAFILMDIPGVKPRTSNEKIIKINRGQMVLFGNHVNSNKYLNIALTKQLPHFKNDLESFTVNDGQFLFEVQKTGNGWVVGKSEQSFELLPKKGINLPRSIYNEEIQYDIYKKFIKDVQYFDINALGLSFVQTGDLVSKIRKSSKLLLVSKIENIKGLENCADIAAKSDAIMIDRGDLVAEISYPKLYDGIDKIAKTTKSAGKPLIMATENLESMMSHTLPSKSDVVALGHAAQIGTDCFMLSEETAISTNKHEILEWLTKFLSELKLTDKTHSTALNQNSLLEIFEIIEEAPDMPIVIMTKSGRALSRFLARNPNASIFLVTNDLRSKSLAALYKNKIRVLTSDMKNKDNIDTLVNVIRKHKNTVFADNDQVLAIFVSKYIKKPHANSLSIFSKKDM